MPEPSTASNEGEPPMNAYVPYMLRVTETLPTLACRYLSQSIGVTHVCGIRVKLLCIWFLRHVLGTQDSQYGENWCVQHALKRLTWCHKKA